MIGVQFKTVCGADKDIATIGTLDSSMEGFDEDGNYASSMMIWNPTTQNYSTYGWTGSSGTDILEDSDYDNIWSGYFDPENVPTGKLPETGAFWVKAGAAGTILLMGEVPTTNVTVSLTAGYNMVAHPLPKDVPVATFGTLDASMAGFDEDGNYATSMMVWNPTTQNYSTYGWTGSSGTDILEDSDYDNVWSGYFDPEAVPAASIVVPAGSGVWIKAGSAGSITFSVED